ncbi:MAG: hypothetical protein H6712_23935 [Myxococcales bacterium]|nr:hypothetical protein [Myxococcales bacterium]MCB9716930.1 hypothetical protein [Myxococcales bacterium]
MHAPTSHPSKRALRTGTLASVLLGLGPIGACVEPDDDRLGSLPADDEELRETSSTCGTSS